MVGQKAREGIIIGAEVKYDLKSVQYMSKDTELGSFVFLLMFMLIHRTSIMPISIAFRCNKMSAVLWRAMRCCRAAHPSRDSPLSVGPF